MTTEKKTDMGDAEYIAQNAELQVTIRMRDSIGNYGGGHNLKESTLAIALLRIEKDIMFNQITGDKTGEAISRKAREIVLGYIRNPRAYSWNWIKEHHGCA